MRRMLSVPARVTFTAVALGALALSAPAGDLTVSASVGNLAAAAKFQASGSNLIVTLTNTSTFDVLVPADVLTCLFFDVSGAPLSLTTVSAIVPPTSTVLFGVSGPGGEVGGEWEYEDGLIGAPQNAAYGIGSSGLGLFGSGQMFPGANLQGPAGVDGLQYGLVSAGDDPNNGNTPVTGSNALIKNEVVFTLAGLPVGFDPETMIKNVNWQYGTSLTEPNIPEPASLGLLLAGAAVVVLRRRNASV